MCNYALVCGFAFSLHCWRVSPKLLLEHSLFPSRRAIFSPVVGSAGGCRRRSLCPECSEEFLNAHPRNGSCLPNSPHQGSGEATHDSRYRAVCPLWACSGSVLPGPACLWVCSRLLSGFLSANWQECPAVVNTVLSEAGWKGMVWMSTQLNLHKKLISELGEGTTRDKTFPG